jgi:hypothetical protein
VNEYTVYLNVAIANPETSDRFSIHEEHDVALSSFADLDRLLARIRRAVKGDDSWKTTGTEKTAR